MSDRVAHSCGVRFGPTVCSSCSSGLPPSSAPPPRGGSIIPRTSPAPRAAAAAERFLRVQAAWKALGTADARADYDASAVRAHASVTNAERVLLSELEAALVHDGQDDGYQRQCRCGDCYEISAQDLADGFNTVQCNGCSLYITVA